jgi:hypothetical protein
LPHVTNHRIIPSWVFQSCSGSSLVGYSIA